jgi:DNA-directed RNA polymerase specialized sigma24 family protein
MAITAAASELDPLLKDLWLLARREATRRCSSDLSPDDVAQEVLMAFVQQRTAVRDPRAWVTSVTRRVAFKLDARNQRCVPSTVETDIAPPIPSNLRIDLRRALGQLDARTLKLLSWTIRGETHLEIAARLGCARRDIGTLVHRARQRTAALAGVDLRKKTRVSKARFVSKARVVSKARIKDTSKLGALVRPSICLEVSNAANPEGEEARRCGRPHSARRGVGVDPGNGGT